MENANFEDYYAEKPWEGTIDSFGIRDIVIYRAIKHRRLLRIFYKDMIAIYDPKQWRKTAEVIYREYLRPGEPMRLFLNKANLEKPKTVDEQLEELCKQGVF